MKRWTVGQSDSRTVKRLLVLCTLLSVSPPVRLSALQCPDGSPPPCGPTPHAPTPPRLTSVAVLYFDNLSRDTADAYLAEGLTEEIISRLTQIERLTVKSRTAVRRYHGAGVDPTALGRALGVAHLVSGSVRRAGNRVRVTVELLRASNGVGVWSERYDRTDADLLAVEEDIASAVATSIAGRLLPTERASLTARPTRNPQAYDHFLHGNYLLGHRNPTDARRAIEEYDAAARLDPSFARALARIGLAYGLFLGWGWPYPTLTADSMLARGSAAVDRALSLDSADADAWMARGVLLSYRNPRTFAGVLPALERAIALDPRNAEAHHIHGTFLRNLGEDTAALAALRRALALEPERAITIDNIALVPLLLRQYDEAERMLDSAVAVDPAAYYAYVDQGWVRLVRGDVAGARTSAETAVRLGPPTYSWRAQPVLAALEARAGDTVAARARLGRLMGQFADPAHPGLIERAHLAMGYAQLGDRDQALRLLESVEPRGIVLWWYLRHPAFDPLRTHPRFQRLVAETRPPGAK